MDCIPYINDLQIEIQILKDVKANGNCDIEIIEKKIEEKEQLLNTCRINLNKLSNNQICYKLYLYMLDGLSPSQAVKKIADENYKNDKKPTSVSIIWEKYYKKLKKMIKLE